MATREGIAECSREGAILYPWSTILGCDLGELGGNPCVTLEVGEHLDVGPGTFHRTVDAVHSGVEGATEALPTAWEIDLAP